MRSFISTLGLRRMTVDRYFPSTTCLSCQFVLAGSREIRIGTSSVQVKFMSRTSVAICYGYIQFPTAGITHWLRELNFTCFVLVLIYSTTCHNTDCNAVTKCPAARKGLKCRQYEMFTDFPRNFSAMQLLLLTG